MSEPQDNAAGRTQELLLLGQIHGLVQALRDGQELTVERLEALDQKVDKKLEAIDTRLRVVEQKAAVAGAVSGGAMAIGTALIIEGIKHWLRRGGPGT